MRTRAPAKAKKSYIQDNRIMVRFKDSDYAVLKRYAKKMHSQLAPIVRKIVLRELAIDPYGLRKG